MLQSLIIIATDKQKRQVYIQEYAQKLAISTFDLTIIEKEETSKNTQSIGIDDVKAMQKKVFLKPLKGKQKAIVLDDAQLLTREAQNALLKVLEEPPEHTYLILSADSKEAFLPTILSRCQLIVIPEVIKKLTDKKRQDFQEFFERLPTMPIGERLKKAELLAKDKEKALTWIASMIRIMREEMVTNVILGTNKVRTPESQTITDSGRASLARMTEYLRSFQELHTTIKTTNVNARFAIEQTLLSLATSQV
ncbi:MAG: hypothetical protein AAB553_03710 [Patescibacteria group bacterium]